MKKQLNQLRRFFARTGAKRLNAATAREVIPASYDDDDTGNRLSGAFIVVLLLHVIALVGVFAFSRMKDTKTVSASTDTATKMASKPAAPLPGAGTGASALTAPLPTPTPEVAPPSEEPPARSEPIETNGRTHIVKTGENLTKIAVSYRLRATDLMSANGLKTDEIKVGQVLVIPEAKKAVEAPKIVSKAPEKSTKVHPSTYRVQKNDTLLKISRQLGVKYEDFVKLNNIKDPRKLQEGQVLKVPKKG